MENITENIHAVEYYEKCRALLHVADTFDLDDTDREALIWCAQDYLEMLGQTIGLFRKK